MVELHAKRPSPLTSVCSLGVSEAALASRMIEVYNKADLLPESGAPLPAPDPSPAPDARPGSHLSTSNNQRQRSDAGASPSERFTSAHEPLAGPAAADRLRAGDKPVGASAERMDGLYGDSAGNACADRQPQDGAAWLQARGAVMHVEASAPCAPSAACAPGAAAAAGMHACGGYAAEQAATAHEAGAGERPSAEGACQDGSRGGAAGAHAPPEGSGQDGARAGMGEAAPPRLYTSTVTRAGLYELLREIDRKARARRSALLTALLPIHVLMRVHSPLLR